MNSYLELVWQRFLANHEKKLASRARIRAAQEGKHVSKWTRSRRKHALRMEAIAKDV